MKIMLLDSAHIQESDAEYENRKGERAGREHVDPLYTEQDALDVFKYVTTCEYKEKVDLCEGVSAVFTDAGHLLGSASITLELEENGVHKTIVFSAEIVDLQNFINAMGGNVRGAGGSIITVEGKRALHGGKYRIIADRIVGATYLCAAACCGGEVRLRGVDPRPLSTVSGICK